MYKYIRKCELNMDYDLDIRLNYDSLDGKLVARETSPDLTH